MLHVLHFWRQLIKESVILSQSNTFIVTWPFKSNSCLRAEAKNDVDSSWG